MKRFAQRMLGLLVALALIASFICPALPAPQAQATTQTLTVSSDLSMQDGVTLHCWNWSYANIEANMQKIVDAGYTAIQVSPIQTAKQATAGSSAKDWWVFYQPADFAIDNTGRSALGTKAQFTSMCNAAHAKGIKVIVDVVANHMGNTNAGYGISSAINPDIRDDSSCWHDVNTNISNYHDRYNITQYCLDGVPDLNTANPKVQNYVLNYLKECVDAGADGFRFDAAKHIETPEDVWCASDFWPNVINGIKAYDPDVYVYAEVLFNADEDNTLPTSAYSKYMSVTDNSWSNTVRNNVIGSSSAGNFSYSYHKATTPDNLVLWAESHDNYAGDGSSGMSTANINKTWALAAARADAMALYLARPNNLYNQKLGDASLNTGWAFTEVAEVNKFHTYFAGQGEYVSNQNNIAYVERGTSGVILVNCGGTNTTVNVTANAMANGTYTDQITGNKFTVSNGKISGNIGSTGIAVVYNPVYCDHQWNAGEVTTPATCTTDGLKTYTCTLCGGTSKEVLPATGHDLVNRVCTVCGYVKPADKTLYFANTSGWSTVNAYVWDEAGNEYSGVWPGTAMTNEGDGIWSVTVSGEAENIIFNNVDSKTDDLVIPSDADLYTFSTGVWSVHNLCSHQWDNGTVTTPATCTTNGVKTYTCALCSATEAETIPAPGHNYVDGVCNTCGEATPTGTQLLYDNSSTGWKTVYIYTWDAKGTPTDGAWPGTPMTNEGSNIWSYCASLDGVNVIFNNGSSGSGNQTDDLVIPGNNYIYNGTDWDLLQETCSHPSHSINGVCSDCGLTVGHTYVDGVCSLCGEADPDYILPITPPSLRVPGRGLSFKDEIYYNVYFFIDNPDNVEIAEMGLITWTSAIDGDITNAEYVCPGAAPESDYFKTRSQAISAKNMGEQLYYKVYLKLADGTYIYSELKNYSAKDYCTSMLSKDTTSAAVKSLCVALMNYGAAAQEYFGYKTDELMNAGLTAGQQALVDVYADAMIPALVEIGSKADGLAANGGFTAKAPSISFGGALGINYNFKPANAITGMKLYIWTQADAAAADVLTLENASLVIDAAAGTAGVYTARLTGIAAKNAGDTVYACGVYELDGVTYYSGLITYSVSAYCQRYANSTNAVQKLAAATAVYTYYANAFLH